MRRQDCFWQKKIKSMLTSLLNQTDEWRVTYACILKDQPTANIYGFIRFYMFLILFWSKKLIPDNTR